MIDHTDRTTRQHSRRCYRLCVREAHAYQRMSHRLPNAADWFQAQVVTLRDNARQMLPWYIRVVQGY